MTRIDNYPPGVPCFVDTLTDELEAARAFYAQIFGWTYAGPAAMPTDPPGEYWIALAGGSAVAGLGTRVDPEIPPGWSTNVAVASADAAADVARDAGGTVLREPVDVPPAGRMAVIADPDGAFLCLWQAATRSGAELVNAPSAWAMSLLSTPDPERAAAFYAALFGWRAEPLPGADGIQILRLPGYVGGVPEQPVPRDVVAALAPLDPGGAPGWAVDFWIADTDAAADAAPELGGAVIAQPFDAPMFRRAVLAAPGGAVFSISELRPENR